MPDARGTPVVRTVLVALVTLAFLAIGVVPDFDAGAATRANPILPPHEPMKNFRLASLNHVVVSINSARASEEGLAPLIFDDARFLRLSVAQQIFVVSNLERVTRGLYPAMVMVKRLDTIAAAAARHDQDPTDGGVGYSSIWSDAPASFGQYALFADFGWMYDDGPPPQYIFRNVDCAHAGQSGCWGHRNNILSKPLASGWFSCRHPEMVAGTGFAPHTIDGPSLAQIFEVACSPAASGVEYSWRSAVAYLKLPPSQSGLAA